MQSLRLAVVGLEKETERPLEGPGGCARGSHAKAKVTRMCECELVFDPIDDSRLGTAGAM